MERKEEANPEDYW